jgi:hypothetical protein
MILNSPTISGSLTVTGNIIASGSITLSGSIASASYAATASFVALAQSASNAVSAQTASFANAFTVASTLTAQTLVVQTITSSVDFVTGSTRFGSILGNTHVFSGSVSMNPNGLFVSSSGFVGIGTTSPTRQLFVNDTVFFDNIGSGSTSNPSIAIGSTSLGISYLGGSNMALIANSNTRMYISASGAVGIGATSPVGNLNLWGGAAQYVVLTNTAADGVTSATQGGIIGQARGYGNNLSQMASILFKNNSTTWYKGEISFNTNDSDGTNPSVTPTERMRIVSAGWTKISNNGTYLGVASPYHEIYSNQNNNAALVVTNSNNTYPYGVYAIFTGASPNDNTRWFFNGEDSTTTRFIVRSNGGIVNYQANDTNLSDIRTKKDILLLESYWNKFKAIEIVKFKYKDQTHDDYNIGVIAQQVEEIAPEFVDIDGFGETPEDGIPFKTVYTSDLHHTTIKVLQEAMAKIETLQAQNDALQSRIETLESK